MAHLMVEAALRERDLFLYKFTILCVVTQFGAIVWWSRPSRRRQSRAPRPPSDAFWFLPVFVWGLESLRHCAWWVFEGQFRGIGVAVAKTLPAFLPRIMLTELMLGITLCGCFLAENVAHRGNLAARIPQATLPLSVVAAIVGVQWAWGLLVLAFVPVL
jgi:hypothetical protein